MIDKLAVAVLVAFCCLAAPASAQNGTLDANGWTIFEPSADSKVFYVSSSTGNDLGNDGLSTAKPFKTLAHAKGQLRNGFPDHLLLKRGDVWQGGDTIGHIAISGRSATEPIVISYYGTTGPLPKILAGGTGKAISTTSTPVDYVAIIGLHLIDTPKLDTEGGTGIRWLASTRGFLIEGCIIDSFVKNIIVQGFFGPIVNVKIRRNNILRAFNAGQTNSSGMFFKLVRGLQIEENFVDANGFKLENPDAPPSILNHGCYIQVDCVDVETRGNIFSRSSSHGCQMRHGGIAENNVFVKNPIGLSFGVVEGPKHEAFPGGVFGVINNNLFLHSTDIQRDPVLPRGWGLEIGNINSKGAVISNNIFAHIESTNAAATAISLAGDVGVGIERLRIVDNVIYDWTNSIAYANVHKDPIKDPEWFDSDGNEINIFFDILIENNAIQMSGAINAPLIRHSRSLSLENARYRGNLYYSPFTDAMFRSDARVMSYPEWIDIAKDNASQELQLTFPDPANIETYISSIGVGATYDDFAAAAGVNTKVNWNSDLTAAAIIAYFKTGYKTDWVFSTEVRGQGSLVVTPPNGPYTQGTEVSVQAVADPGNQFLYFYGDSNSTSPTGSVTMNGHRNVTAVFIGDGEPRNTLNLTSGQGGTIRLDPPGGIYPVGENVRVVGTEEPLP